MTKTVPKKFQKKLAHGKVPHKFNKFWGGVVPGLENTQIKALFSFWRRPLLRNTSLCLKKKEQISTADRNFTQPVDTKQNFSCVTNPRNQDQSPKPPISILIPPLSYVYTCRDIVVVACTRKLPIPFRFSDECIYYLCMKQPETAWNSLKNKWFQSESC